MMIPWSAYFRRSLSLKPAENTKSDNSLGFAIAREILSLHWSDWIAFHFTSIFDFFLKTFEDGSLIRVRLCVCRIACHTGNL